MTYLVLDAARRHAPPTWQWSELRRVATLRREPNTRQDFSLLALSSERGVEVRPEDGGRQLPSEATISDYWIVRPSDLVLNPMWAIGGGVAVSEVTGAVSPAYRVYSLSDRLEPRFLHYWVRSYPVIEQYRLLTRGITTFDRSVTREDFEGLPVPIPDRATQRCIARFLDAETSRIDALIDKKQRLAFLIEERLSGAISAATRADTCADDAAARAADSIGWRVLRLRRCFSSMDYGLGDAASAEGRYPVLGMGNVGDGQIVGEASGYVSEVDPRLLLRPGDLLFNRTNSPALVGKLALFSDGAESTTFASYLVRLRTTELAVPEYLNYALNTPAFLALARSNALPSIGQANLNPNRYASLSLALPPVTDQRRIAGELDRERETVESVLSVLRRQVALLVERRQALITAAVTGELDLSEAA